MRPLLLAPAALAALAALVPLAPARATSSVPAPAAAPGLAEDVGKLKAQLLKERDDADEKLIEQLADAGTRDAMEALLEVYGSMASIWMRRETVKALGRFDDVDDAFQPALEKVMNVATEAREPELRAAALEALGKARQHGKTFLALIVDSPAQDDIRVEAMRAHTKLGSDDDKEWYRKQYERRDQDAADSRRERPKRPRRGEEEVKQLYIPRLAQIRRLAMEMLLPDLSDTDLLNDFREDRSLTIKRVALGELHRRDHSGIGELARELLERVDTPGVMRAFCAEIVADVEGTKVADDFIDLASKNTTQEVLRLRMADLLVGMNDEKVNKKLIALVGKGKPHEKAFALRVTRHIDDDKLMTRVRKGLKDRDPEVQRATLDAVGARRDTEALKDLEKMLDKSKDPDLTESLLAALSAIHDGSNEWVERLVGFAGSADLTVRNAAIYELGRLGRRTLFDLFVQKLGDANWSTRYAAVRALEALRTTDATGAIVTRLPEETGRMKDLLTDALWRLTGQPFGTRVAAWQSWWTSEGKDLPPIAESELEKLQLEAEERRLRQVSTVAEFFGIQIRSHRVIFIIDTSGSMMEQLRTRYIGEQGETRIDVAKRELAKAVEGLDPTALFNILIFNSGMERWRDEGIATKTESTRAEALEYISRLGAGGATNIYGALELAFEDPDVDTIVMLGDGEPTAGDLVDAGLIREAVREWNDTRAIQIHTVAVGGSLQLMEWLAEDSGGRYVEFN